MMKNMLRFSFLFALITLTQGCQVIEDNKRIQVQGKIVDGNGNPIPDIFVRCMFEENTLGVGGSDAEGNFSFVSLDSGSRGLEFTINTSSPFSNEPQNPLYTAKIYYRNFDFNAIDDYNFGTVHLLETTVLNVAINNIPGDTNTLSYFFEYQPTICSFNFGDLTQNEDCQTVTDFFNSLEANSDSIEFQIPSQLGTNVSFTYTLNNEASQTVLIPLTANPTNYVFEY